jgi:hypothetical protein
MKVLLAIDVSHHSEEALEAVASREWPADAEAIGDNAKAQEQSLIVLPRAQRHPKHAAASHGAPNEEGFQFEVQ